MADLPQAHFSYPSLVGSVCEFREQLQFAIRLWIFSTVSSGKFGWRSSNRITTIDTNGGTRHKIRGS
jgi:hypothetical protein